MAAVKVIGMKTEDDYIDDPHTEYEGKWAIVGQCGPGAWDRALHICQSVLVMFTQFWSPQCLDSWPPDSEGEEAQQQEQGLSGETPDTEVGLN